MKRIWALALLMCLILGFQNCSQNSMQGTGSLDSGDVSINITSPASSSSDGGTISSAKVSYVEVPNVGEAGQVSLKASEVTPYRLVISIESGGIQLLDDSNAVLENRCLSAEHLQELKTILNGASVCEAEKSSEELCAMSYTPGYASLLTEESLLKLGEAKDSCGTGKKDLCGVLSQVFQAYVTNLRLHWNEMSCE